MNACITWAFLRSEKGRHNSARAGPLTQYCRFSKRQWDYLKQQRRLDQPTMTMRSCVGIAVCDFCRAVSAPNGARKWKSLTPAKARRFSCRQFSLGLRVGAGLFPVLFVLEGFQPSKDLGNLHNLRVGKAG